MIAKTPFALYVHYPFCLAKCPYCDFNSHVREAVDQQKWLEAYWVEMEYMATLYPNGSMVSIFFGGGTPSLMEPKLVEGIINKAHQLWEVAKPLEITLEANPTSSEKEKFRAFKSAGINRLSLGIQSFNADDLRFLGRKHSVEEARGAITMAASVFENYSFDLIYARPHQQVKVWKEELKEALLLASNHLSLYQLTIEKGTPFYQSYRLKEFEIPNEQHAHDLYETTQDVMEDHAMPAYEISNHAKPGHECRHNLAYWQSLDYVGIGPGAHGRITHADERQSTMTVHQPEAWLDQVTKQRHGILQQTTMTKQERFEELLMMGLRINEGLPYKRILDHLGGTKEQWLPDKKILALTSEGLVLNNDYSLQLSRRGRLVLNQMVAYLT